MEREGKEAGKGSWKGIDTVGREERKGEKEREGNEG